MVVDLFPPSLRTPHGIHPLIWRQFSGDQFSLPAEKPMTQASYDAGAAKVAYVQPVALGDSLTDMPIFLAAERYVPCPLEATYLTT